jgi:hypothetical protein
MKNAPKQIRFNGVSLFNRDDLNGFDIKVVFQQPRVLDVVDNRVSHFFAYRQGEGILREVGDLHAYMFTPVKDVIYSVFRIEVEWNNKNGFAVVHRVIPVFLKEDESDFFKNLKMVLIDTAGES